MNQADTIKELNAVIAHTTIRARLAASELFEEPAVDVIDTTTNIVVASIPHERLANVARKLWEQIGTLLSRELLPTGSGSIASRCKE
jgi:uncharacterized FlaG/YvyC family protein